jgi:hypothetical protein
MPLQRPNRFPDEPKTVRKARAHVEDVKVLDKHSHLIRMNLRKGR